MIPGGPTEIISQFAGHLHLAIEEARARLEYNDGALKALSDDYVARSPAYESPAELDEFPTHRLSVPESALESADEGYPHQRKAVLDKTPADRIAPPTRDELDKTFGPAGGGGGRSAGGGGASTDRDLVIKVTYGDDSSQLQTTIHQFNRIDDDDRFGVPIDSVGAPGLERLPELIDAASEQIPAELAFPEIGIAAVAEFIEAQDAAKAEGQGRDGDPIEPGVYVNGILQPADYARPETPEENTVQNLDAKGQWMELGGNTVINAALIVDINEAAPTLIVQQNVFQTNAFVQINAFVDNDQVVLGNQLPKTQITGQNTANNIAEFEKFEGFHGPLKGFSSGPTWHVDVIEHDLYDINLLIQENYLQDNDIVAQTTSNTHFTIVAGDNGAYNLIDLKSLASDYDVIIVGGNMHAANLLFQTNILLDNDVLKIASERGDATAQSAVTGENDLLNDGTIITFGNDDFQPLTSVMKDLIGELDNGETTLDPSYGALLPRNGPGPLDILYIKGDFFDINAIWQTNIVSDLDMALQIITDSPTSPTPSEATSHEGEQENLTQSVSTGENQLSNFATIVDVGSTFGFTDGDVYDDSILVQMNVVTEDKDSVIKMDTDALVNEVIAFTGADEDESIEYTFKPMPVPQDDMIGGVVT